MSQSSESHIPHPQPLLQKIAVALAVVLVGHVGVLWAVSQIKAPELKPVEKKPIKVRMVKEVKIKEPPPPPPPPQVKKKEKPQVKEVKIVKKATPPPAKEVKKVVTVKAATPPKPVSQPQKTKPVVPSTVISSTTTNSNATKPTTTVPVVQPVTTPQTPSVSPTPTPTPNNPPPATTPSVIHVGSGGVSWKNSPNLNFKESEIKESCTVKFTIKADEKGKITSVVVINSTCDAKLTARVQGAAKNARFYPYKENGVAHPISVNQSLTLNPPKKK